MKKSKDLELLRKSIKHWCLDIRRPLLKGDEITDAFKWKIDGGKVKMLSDSCALCVEYIPMCACCPLNAINEGCRGGDSPYSEFYYNVDIKSANNMILTLVGAYWATMQEEYDGIQI